MAMLVKTILLCVATILCVEIQLSAQENDIQDQTWLPRAHARPVNVDPKVDCAVKELAWEYAKKLLPQVSNKHGIIIAGYGMHS